MAEVDDCVLGWLGREFTQTCSILIIENLFIVLLCIITASLYQLVGQIDLLLYFILQ